MFRNLVQEPIYFIGRDQRARGIVRVCQEDDAGILVHRGGNPM